MVKNQLTHQITHPVIKTTEKYYHMEREGHLFDIFYTTEEGEPVINLYIKTDDGVVIGKDKDFQPYMYVLPREDKKKDLRRKLGELKFEEKGDRIKVIRIDEKNKTDLQEEKTVFQTYVKHPRHIPKLKEHIKDWEEVAQVNEYDIPFYKRYLIDKRLKPPSKVYMKGEEIENDDGTEKMDLEEVKQIDEKDILEPNILAFDLEVVNDEVVMCSFYKKGFRKVLVSYEQDYKEEYVEVVENEKKLLRRIQSIFRNQDYTVITGYNTDQYDFKVLRDRFEEHGIDFKIGGSQEVRFKRRGRNYSAKVRGRIHIDLYPFVATVISRTLDSETLDLNSVAGELIGKSKEDMEWSDIKKSWETKKNLDTLASYALKDSKLAHELAENIVPQIFSLSSLIGITPFDTCRTSYGQLVENYLIKEAYIKDIIVPNRPTQYQIKDRRTSGRFTGAFVYEPEKGLYENIALFDFKSLYPTIIVSHNLSPDTLEKEGCGDELMISVGDDEFSFCQDEKGFFPEILEKLITERYNIKKEMKEYDRDTQLYRNNYNRQNALKILSNAFYGYMGYSSARWYSRESAEATTKLGRDYIKKTIEVAEEMGLKVVYGDTDSVFLSAEDIEEKTEEFGKIINSELPGLMELELEGMFKRGFFTYTDKGKGAKKKYALLKDNGELKITGFEYVRRDWSPIAKETQKEVLRKVLERDVEGAYDTVKSVIKRLKKGDIPLEKLTIYTTLTKRPENYGTKSPHVEAAKKAIKKGERIKPGDTVDYIITNKGKTISEKAQITKYADNYDAGYYIEKQIIPVSERVLKVFGYTESQLKGEGRQSGLDRFS